MRPETRVKFDRFMEKQAKLNGITSAAVKFTVTPTVQQRLESAIQESTAFLQLINILGVDEKEGEALMLGVGSTIAGRTNTSVNNPRQPRNVSGLTKDSYACAKTDSDTSIPYQLLDTWAKFPDFQTRLSRAIVERQGLDRIMIGFNGTSVAVQSDRDVNPLLQDVNIGWLQKLRTKAPERVLSQGDVAGKVTIGATGDYKTLDGLVYDGIQMLDQHHRKRPDLVVIADRNLLHEKYLKALEKSATSNQEENAAQEIMTRARIGGLPIVDAPFFPDGTVLITTLKNLSIYYQLSARRRMVKEEPEYDRIADYQSSNDAYVIEDLGLCAMIENIEEAV